MSPIQALIFSVVEGISEFLPISSTGHLVLTSEVLKISQTNFVKDFEIIIQLGAILSIVVLYYKKFLTDKETLKRIITAFLPTAVVGFILFNFIKSFLLGNLYITLWALFIGGFILIALELIYKEKEHHVDSVDKITLKNAFIIGVFQSLAIIPGVSRSAATIISALFLGTKRKAAAEFSFLLAVPTMLAATGLDLIKSDFAFTFNELGILLIGFVGSFAVALIVVKWFLKYIQNHTFIPFGIYRIIASILFYLVVIR